MTTILAGGLNSQHLGKILEIERAEYSGEPSRHVVRRRLDTVVHFIDEHASASVRLVVDLWDNAPAITVHVPPEQPVQLID